MNFRQGNTLTIEPQWRSRIFLKISDFCHTLKARFICNTFLHEGITNCFLKLIKKIGIG